MGHSEGIGIIASPIKFKNFEPQIGQAALRYKRVLAMPDEAIEGEKEGEVNKDGARKLLELVTHRFLSQVDLSSW